MSDPHKIFIGRLDEAITESLDRLNNDKENKYVPILSVLMGKGTENSKFSEMTDNEFEYLFLGIVSENFVYAKNMAFELTIGMRSRANHKTEQSA